MKNFITLLERYLFDIIGVIVPGLTSVILYYLIIKNDAPTELIEQLQTMEYNTITWTAIIIFLYILGMFVKVVAIKTYEIMGSAFGNSKDCSIPRFFNMCMCQLNASKNKCLIEFFEQKNVSGTNCVCWIIDNVILYPIKIFVRILVGILYNVAKLLETATTFKVDRCPHDYKSLYIELRREMKEQNIADFDNAKDIEEDAIQLYKLSSVIIRLNELKALFDNFLAKYNLFRSLSLVFGAFGLYSLFFYKGEFAQYYTICLLIAWFVFHYKYIRYWGLCGGDAISTALIYLKAHKQQ